MKILKRHKDSSGSILGYTVEIKGTISFKEYNYVVQRKELVTNAKFTLGNDFRANKGSNIETVVDNTGILSINNRNTNITAYRNTEQNSIDFYGKQYINICRKIRNYARQGKLVVEKRVHKSNDGNNVHLFRMIEACGLSVDQFVNGYLSVLQPYNLEKFRQNKDLGKHNTWICELGYRVSMLIKLDESNTDKPLIVSFHESNSKHKNKFNYVDFSLKPCAILIEAIKSEIVNTGEKSVNYFIQKGFMRLSIESFTPYVNNDVALVKYNDIEKAIRNSMDRLFDYLRNMYTDEDTGGMPLLDLSSNKLSFLSFGYATVNNINLLIDLYATNTTVAARSVIVSIANNLLDEIPDNNKLTIREALIQKFGINYNNKLFSIAVDILSIGDSDA